MVSLLTQVCRLFARGREQWNEELISKRAERQGASLHGRAGENPDRRGARAPDPPGSFSFHPGAIVELCGLVYAHWVSGCCHGAFMEHLLYAWHTGSGIREPGSAIYGMTTKFACPDLVSLTVK